MMDAFDEVLAENFGDVCVPVTISAAAPSHDAAAPSGTICIGDDDDDDYLDVDGENKVSTTKAVAVAVTSEKKRRRNVDKSKLLKATPIQHIDATKITCVFVPKKGGSTAIPLWNQYTLVWTYSDFGFTKWVIFSNYEPWLMKVVNASTHKSVRTMSKQFFEHVMNKI